MAKKKFGIDALVQSTIKNETESSETRVRDINNPEGTKGIFINIPASLKKEIDLYCIEQGIKKQNFFIRASRFLIDSRET